MSLFKKAKAVTKSGLTPILKGKYNYNRNFPEVEAKAKSRLKDCLVCDNFVGEPIKMLRIEDKRISVLSNKMCNDCGCALPYLLRQDQKICTKWQD